MNSIMYMTAAMAAGAMVALATAIPEEPPGGITHLNRFDFVTPGLPPDGVHTFETSITVAGEEHRVSLRRHSVRADDFRVVIRRGDGTGAEFVPPPPSTYRGEIVGRPGSIVAASLRNGQITMLAQRPDGTAWAVQPADDLIPGLPPVLHVAFDLADAAPEDGVCGTMPDAPGFAGAQGIADAVSLSGAGGQDSIANLGFDADVEFYQQNNSSIGQTVFDIERVTNAVGAIYRSDVDIDYQITFLIVRVSEPDPYTATEPFALFCEFRAEWNANWPSARRDTAHLMTGRNADGSTIGLASGSVICNVSQTGFATCPTGDNNAYAWSQSTSSNFARRVGLTAHELGHNWSAPHCDGDADCSIMCSNIGGCTGVLDQFGQAAIDRILNHKSSRTCLDACDAMVQVPSEISTVNEAAWQACTGGVLSIQSGDYDEAIRVNRALRIESAGGPAFIGQ